MRVTRYARLGRCAPKIMKYDNVHAFVLSWYIPTNVVFRQSDIIRNVVVQVVAVVIDIAFYDSIRHISIQKVANYKSVFERDTHQCGKL